MGACYGAVCACNGVWFDVQAVEAGHLHGRPLHEEHSHGREMQRDLCHPSWISIPHLGSVHGHVSHGFCKSYIQHPLGMPVMMACLGRLGATQLLPLLQALIVVLRDFS